MHTICYAAYMRTQERASTALAALIPRLARFAANRLEQGEGALSVAQFYVLQRIAEGVVRGSDLAKRSGVSPATMSGIVDRLVVAELVRREPHPEDRRALVLSLTDRGRALLASGERRLDDGVASLLESLSREQRDAIAQGCRAITIALDARVATVTA